MKKMICMLLMLTMVAPLAGCGHIHVPTADVPVAATCTQPGIEGAVRCAICNEVLVQGHEVEATGHIPVTDPAVPATTTAPGQTEGSHCSVCKEVIVPQTITEKLTGGEAQTGVQVRVANPDQAIFSGPGYDNDFVGTIGAAGTYTIVAQESDSKGNRWGRLKSGLGWINMAGTELRSQGQTKPAELPVRVLNGDQAIYSGPGYQYDYVGSVGAAVTYTMVDQKQDVDGNLWGKLKSGLGWIDLTEVAQRTKNQTHITANYADEALLASGNYHSYGQPGGAGVNSIAFRARETVYNVSFCAYDYVNETIGGQLCYLPELTTNKPLVVHAGFPGDFTTYCLQYTDKMGGRHTRLVAISLRDSGGIVFDPA